MKFFTLGLAVSTVGLLSTAGCSAPANPPTAESVITPAPAATTEAVESVQSTPTAEAHAATAKATTKPVVKTMANGKEKPPTEKTSAADSKPDPKYRVVDAASKFGGGAPEEVVKAQQSVQVPPPPLNMKMAAKPRVVLQTSKGPITVELDPKAAPLHVKSFVYLSNLGFFNGTQFHRHADLSGDGKGFIIQGGDPFSKKPENAQFAGMGGPGYEIPRETNSLKHDQLVIAAARSQDPDSAGSQFYITQGPVHFLDDGYTVFGKVVSGKEAALKLTQGDTLKSAKVQK